jgi:hypothetical protein
MMRKYLNVRSFPKERFFDPRIDIPLSEDLNISNKDELFECVDSFSNSSLEEIANVKDTFLIHNTLGRVKISMHESPEEETKEKLLGEEDQFGHSSDSSDSDMVVDKMKIKRKGTMNKFEERKSIKEINLANRRGSKDSGYLTDHSGAHEKNGEEEEKEKEADKQKSLVISKEESNFFGDNFSETDSYSKFDETNCANEDKVLVGRASRLCNLMVHENAEIALH